MPLSKFEDTDHAKLYSNFRPPVPQLVLDVVLNFLSEQIDKKHWNIAVDVGCGSGQCTNALAQHFQTVYGFDISSAQLAEANASVHPTNVHYGISTAENLSAINSCSVQLLTASSAAHWFDFPKFFTEVNRVLASKGVVALIAYFLAQPINPVKPDDQRLTQLYRDIWYDQRIIDYQSSDAMKAREDHYRNIKFPEEYQYVYRDKIIVKREMTADRVIGRLKSTSHYQQLVQTNKIVAEEFSAEIEQKFREILGADDLSQTNVLFNCEYFIAMARKL